MTTPTKPTEREARLRWVPIPLMKVSALAQRELNQARVDHIVANLDLEQIGAPTVSERDGHYWIVDGQHRIEALRQYGLGDEKLQVWVYTDLTESDEAEKFLQLNDVLVVTAMDKFTKGVQAGREVETDIDRIVRAQGLHVTRDKTEGAVRAVGTLRRVYLRNGAKALARTLQIIRDAYGDAGMESSVLDGIGLLCGRYGDQLDDKRAVGRLGSAHGGVNGLLNQAENLRKATGNPKSHCVAAAAVDFYNQGARGKVRLPNWWKVDNDE